ncbi:MAG: hypothetical protein ACPGKS_08805 [Coraliomargarita sp.]
MELSDTQKATIAGWVKQNKSVAEIQNLLRDDLDLSMTYMDVRFLIEDLELTFEEPAEEESSEDEASDAEAEIVDDAVGGVRVEVNPVTPPGALVAGTVDFSDGKQMQWQLNAAGQLGLVPGDDPDYRPSPEDIQEFQAQLQEVLQKQGY